MLKSGVNAWIIHAGRWHHRRIGTCVRWGVPRRRHTHGVAGVHHVRRGVRVAFGGHGHVGPGQDTGVGGRRGELESLCNLLCRWLDIDALADEDLLEVVDVEAGVMPSQECLCLENLALDALDMAAGSESLPVSVLLVALYAGRRARCASWVF